MKAVTVIMLAAVLIPVFSIALADTTNTIPGSSNATLQEMKQKWSDTGYGDLSGTETYAMMKFKSEQIQEWHATRYSVNPLASEGTVGSENTTGSNSLLPLLSYIPKERDQANCGNCWVWGTTGAVELVLHKQAQISDRISIQYVNSNYHNGGKYPYSEDVFACNGGWPEYVADFYLYSGELGGKKILVPWKNENASYADVKGSEIGHTIIPPSSIKTTPNYPISNMTIQTVKTVNVSWIQAKENIKHQIDNGNAVIFCFFLPDEAAWNSYRRFWKYGDEQNDYFPMDQFVQTPFSDETGGGHAVVLTGYQDYGDHGYWEVLNSWGAPDNRPNGVFYIDMYMDYSAKYPNNIQAMYFETVDLKPTATPPDPVSMTLTLLPGWNLISTPKTLRPGNNTYSIFEQVDSAGHSMYTCDPGSGWKKAVPDAEFEPLQGVWVYANTTTMVQLFFDQDPLRSPKTRPLLQGWSTIGFSGATPVSANATLMSVQDQWNYLIPFDSTKQSYEETIIKGESGSHAPSYLMQPGQGYWLYMAGNGTLSGLTI